MENEDGILKKIAEGNKELFGELILKHQDFIFNVVKGVVRFDEEARDITQEVFLRAYENIEKFRGDSKLSSWLYRIAYNLSVNWSCRNKGREVQFDESLAETVADKKSAVDEAYEAALVSSRLDAVIEDMPAKYKIVIKLYYFEEKSYKEIAGILDVPVNTVKIQLLRAKKIIKKSIDF